MSPALPLSPNPRPSAAPAAIALATRLGVEMPIAREVHNALFEGKSVQRCLIDLLARESKDELADYRQWTERVTASQGDEESG